MKVAFLCWPRFSASTSAHGGDNSACSATAKRKTMLLMARKAVPKAKQDAFQHICGKRRIVVKQLSDRQQAYAQRLPTCATEQYPI